jgi:hypothetical protein
MEALPPNDSKRDYPYAVAHRILIPGSNEQPKETDMLEYCVSLEHARALAQQGLAAGWVNVSIIDLKKKVKR